MFTLHPLHPCDSVIRYTNPSIPSGSGWKRWTHHVLITLVGATPLHWRPGKRVANQIGLLKVVVVVVAKRIELKIQFECTIWLKIIQIWSVGCPMPVKGPSIQSSEWVSTRTINCCHSAQPHHIQRAMLLIRGFLASSAELLMDVFRNAL